MKRAACLALGIVLGTWAAAPTTAGDWPMWRCDANRSAATDQGLAPALYPQWVREYAPLETAWPDPIIEPHRMPFDRVYQPVVEGKTLYVGSSASDKVTALDTDTGAEKWVFYADGPVRLPPVARGGKVYFTSDDGRLYCLNGSDGSLLWKFRGGPGERTALGNGRLVSSWPARGGPVLADGTVYFAAGIWPFMGVFVHAVDADTGKAVWTNDACGAMYFLQPHDSPAFSGLAPQGALTVAGDRLLVPNGRSVPACLDRKTGRLLYYHLAENKDKGGSHVSAIGDYFFNSTRITETRSTLGKAWNGEWSVKTHLGEGQWTATVRIPLATVGGPPAPDTDWCFNFARCGIRESPQFLVTDASMEAIKTPPRTPEPTPEAAKSTRMSEDVLKALTALKDKPCASQAEFEKALKALMSEKDFAQHKSRILAEAGPRLRSLWAPGRYPLDAQDCRPIAFKSGEQEFVLPAPVSTPPAMDGTLSDPAWKNGLRLKGFVVANTAAKAAPFPTQVTIVRDAQALYFGFECEQRSSPNLKTRAKSHDDDVGQEESVEIFLDRHDSSMAYYRFAFNAAGSRQDILVGRKIEEYRNVPHSYVCDLASGKRLGSVGEEPALTDVAIYTMGNPVGAYALRTVKDKAEVQTLWECPVDGRYTLIKAGSRLYVGGKGSLSAIDIPKKGAEPKVSWNATVEGTPWSLLAADDKLFAVTLEGAIHCFGPKPVAQPKTYPARPASPPSGDDPQAEAILKAAGVREGYALAVGLETGRTVEALARKTDLHIIVVDPDPKHVAEVRKRLDEAGLYGRRVAVHVGDPKNYPFPPYLASLIFSERADVLSGDMQSLVSRLMPSLRPYGGVMCLTAPGHAGALKTLVCKGGPEGGGTWTHQDADVANTLCSHDRLVRAPLGILWFGGPPPAGMISRHGHPPTELIVGGRMFLSGVNLVRAVDVYTGRVLWEAPFPGIGFRYHTDYHQAGVNRIGSAMAAADDALYVFNGCQCARLDPATGTKKATFELAPRHEGGKAPTWAFVAVWEDLLIAGGAPTLDGSGSRCLAVLDRDSGKALWACDAANSILHNGIVAGGGRLYCIDKLSPAEVARRKRRGQDAGGEPKLRCFDIRSGRAVWGKSGAIVFGSRLALAEGEDILLLSGRPGDQMREETTNRLVALRASTGELLWDKPVDAFRSPPILRGRTIIAQPWARDLRTGEPILRKDPVTGVAAPWVFARNYGCGTVAGSDCLLTFRSAAAGYFDLDRDGGTGNIGGFKSGCSINLIAADGVLAAPDFTATCTCAYQNQTSLGLISMPENESWTAFPPGKAGPPVLRVGVNLGAPGDRVADDGTLWLGYPVPKFTGRVISGMSPWPLAVEVEGGEYFRRHSSAIAGKMPWVAGSGCRGLQEITVALRPEGASKGKPGEYIVRLHFAEPDDVAPGERVFDVYVQEKRVIEGLDIVREAGGPRRAIVKEVRGVRVPEKLTVRFEPKYTGQTTDRTAPILCGLEAVAEK